MGKRPTAAAERAAEATAEPEAACIRVAGVTLTFRSAEGLVQAVEGIDFVVAEGELVTIVGPTGCGKSTLLRLVAGLLSPTSGGVDVRGVPARQARASREAGFVLQDAALLPWRSAASNITLPLEVMDWPPKRQRQRVNELLALMGLTAAAHRLPHELSGGMKQRVAIARALAWNPSILLMDEPFSALDELTRDRLHQDLLRARTSEHTTILFVTHNIQEAVYLADRVVVMSGKPGRIHGIHDVSLPRPRQPEMRESIEFIQNLRSVRSFLAADAP